MAFRTYPWRRFFGPGFLAILLISQICNANASDVVMSGNLSQPTGSSSTVLSASAIWDLTAVQSLNQLDFQMNNKNGVRVLEVAYPSAFQQMASGKLLGAGSTPLQFSYLDQSNDWVTTTNVPATYKVTGSVTSSRFVTKGTYTAVAKCSALFEGAYRAMNSTCTFRFALDNYSQSVAGTTSTRAAAAGSGAISDHQTWGPYAVASFAAGTGSWTLNMNLATSGKQVTGLATVVLETGTTFSFPVKGIYKPQSQQSRLVLIGSGASKGSSLQVTMLGNSITGIKGRVAGQFVKIVLAVSN
jgi:hypothetical protein